MPGISIALGSEPESPWSRFGKTMAAMGKAEL